MKFFRFLGNEVLLGTLIAILSVFTAVSSYQSALASGQSSGFETLGMKNLNDGNAEYLRANQDITQDYNYFDNWYLMPCPRSPDCKSVIPTNRPAWQTGLFRL